ncbi:response regulator transcription factor [Sediminibacterium soli]|uniref:response regulator transcription factor n=1 Tax=Sediminibacterium soli TaxID=2698829 RepID=UPI001379DAA4|nr:response regulator transcription factor [Sediminibacterium soli]NCI48250.1 response regulator transcription factor [Sediminibacterium soli]
MEKRNIRILIADDHSVFRTGLKQLLSQQKNIDVVGEAGNGLELVRRTAELSPDIIITDIGMPVMDGITATRELTRRKQAGRVIVMSAHGREEPILQMLEAGALGYVLKSADQEEISEAIATVFQYKPYFCREITEKLTEIVSRNYQSTTKLAIHFSEREKSIIRLICRECTSKEIAHTMNLSKRTVEGHRTRIMDKIGAKSIAGIITYAVEKGMN